MADGELSASARDHIDWERVFASRMGRMKASEIRELLKLLEKPDIISFAGGIPDPALFPADDFAKAYSAILTDGRQEAALQYSVSEGYPPLRRWIVKEMPSAQAGPSPPRCGTR